MGLTEKSGGKNAADKGAADSADKTRADFRAKLSAWWNGETVPSTFSSKSINQPISAPAEAPKHDVEAWPAERVAAVQMIWGDGFNFPGGGEFAAKLAGALGVDKSSTVLDLGCGLGGGTRTTVQQHKCVVHGFDPSPDLAKVGNAVSQQQGMHKTAPIGVLDFAKPGWRPKCYDAVLARNVVSIAPNKSGLIEDVGETLKSGGRFVVVDWCINNYDHQSDAFGKYVQGEPIMPDLDTATQMSFLVEKAGFNVRSTDDLTETFKPVVIEGWRRISTLLTKGQVSAEEGKAMMREAELWSRRIAAMQAGDLGLVRVKAIKRG